MERLTEITDNMTRMGRESGLLQDDESFEFVDPVYTQEQEPDRVNMAPLARIERMTDITGLIEEFLDTGISQRQRESALILQNQVIVALEQIDTQERDSDRLNILQNQVVAALERIEALEQLVTQEQENMALPTRDAFTHTIRNSQAQDNLESPTDCPICYENIASPFTTSCNHIFCKECMLTWTEESNTCPCCRAKLYRKNVGRGRRYTRQEIMAIMALMPAEEAEDEVMQNRAGMYSPPSRRYGPPARAARETEYRFPAGAASQATR